MRKTALLTVYTCLFFSARSYTQPTQIDTGANRSDKIAVIRLYHQFLSQEESLYNGTEYIPYTAKLANSHPYFQNDDFVKGSVFYDGILYEDVPLQYDIIKHVLIILDYYQKFRMQLITEKIGWFMINNTKFIHLQGFSPGKNTIDAGFYHSLYEGRTTLLKKENKRVQEKLESKLMRYVVEEPAFYIKKNARYYPAGSNSNVLEAFSDKKAEIRQYIRQNNLSISDEPDKALASIVAYYDTITK
jgi:hypothetical protein